MKMCVLYIKSITYSHYDENDLFEYDFYYFDKKPIREVLIRELEKSFDRVSKNTEIYADELLSNGRCDGSNLEYKNCYDDDYTVAWFEEVPLIKFNKIK